MPAKDHSAKFTELSAPPKSHAILHGIVVTSFALYLLWDQSLWYAVWAAAIFTLFAIASSTPAYPVRITPAHVVFEYRFPHRGKSRVIPREHIVAFHTLPRPRAADVTPWEGRLQLRDGTFFHFVPANTSRFAEVQAALETLYPGPSDPLPYERYDFSAKVFAFARTIVYPAILIPLLLAPRTLSVLPVFVTMAFAALAYLALHRVRIELLHDTMIITPWAPIRRIRRIALADIHRYEQHTTVTMLPGSSGHDRKLTGGTLTLRDGPKVHLRAGATRDFDLLSGRLLARFGEAREYVNAAINA